MAVAARGFGSVCVLVYGRRKIWMEGACMSTLVFFLRQGLNMTGRQVLWIGSAPVVQVMARLKRPSCYTTCEMGVRWVWDTCWARTGGKLVVVRGGGGRQGCDGESGTGAPARPGGR